MIKTTILAIVCSSLVWLVAGQEIDYRPGNCSFNVNNCALQARCVDKEENQVQSYTCECLGDATGTGFKDGGGCTLPYKPCASNNDCPQFASCNTESNICECNIGYTGDGHTCEDVDECTALVPPCDPNAFCTNEPGSFKCVCDIDRNYKGDGFTCRLFCHSHDACDWPRARCNGDNRCECIAGYTGDGMTCQDVDECLTGQAENCDENAECRNTPGSYTCVCKNGYDGDGTSCQALPSHCGEIPKRKNNRFYKIDPDGEGPANAFMVKCRFIANKHWASMVVPKGNFPLAAPEIDQPLDINYEPDPEDLKALINNSAFCSQSFSFACSPGFSLFPGTTWFDVNGDAHNSWGSQMPGMCACGELQRCPDRCYCDGSQTDASTTDAARVVDKDMLPLTSIRFTQGQADKGRVDVEPLMCSTAPFYIPKDCHEAKFKNDADEDQILYIDLDGAGGEAPFQVFCDMESYEHVGITQIPSTGGSRVDVTTEDGEMIEYTIDHNKIRALIEGSLFCSQRVEFQCTNSHLGGADGGAVYVRGDVQRLDYFPGGNHKPDSCACGATESCDQPEVTCNCNIDDGNAHKDFGLIIDKNDLPVTKVTAQVGASRSSVYEIGELKCSQKQFGIEPNCEKYYATGVTESYTYFIDADGTGGNDPFPVECEFVENPPQGKTIVHHNKEGNITAIPSLELLYLMANPSQIESLLSRSTFCTQEVSIDCRQFTIPVEPGSILWTGQGEGPAGSHKLSDHLDSCGPNGDSCKCSTVGGSGKDYGTITDKNILPIDTLDFGALQSGFDSGASLQVDVGPLVCSEVFPTCKQLFEFVTSGLAVEGEATVVNGYFTTDPDGAGGVEPFEVQCTFPETIIEVPNGKGEVGPDPDSPLEPISKCFDISYTSSRGSPISPAQATAMVDASTKCAQSLSLKCQNAPATKMVNFTTCDGKTQVGWAGSYGKDSCACGVNGNCDGGPSDLCNCDKAGNKQRVDSGVIYTQDRLPVCQVCLSIDPPSNGKGWPTPSPSLQFEVGNLVCDRPAGTFGSCQNARRGYKLRSRQQELMRPLAGDPPVPVGCILFRDPPLGIMIVKPKDPVNKPTDDEPVDISITYITLNISIIGNAISEQQYCSQKIFLYCAQEGTGNLTGNFAWYGRDGSAHQDWTPLAADGEDVQRNCDRNPKYCTTCGNPQGFLVTEKDLLPVTRLILAGSNIAVVIENTECFDLLSSCQEIYDTNQRSTGYFGKNRYIIDVDKAGPLRPFRVLCEFDKYTDNAVTVIDVGGEWQSSYPISGENEQTTDFDLEVEYLYATPDQINGLAKISGFCWQGVQFKCQHYPLLEDPIQPSSYYRLYDGQPASSFGTGEDVDFHGCACHKLGVCTTAYSCNCDAEGPKAVDQGAITNRDSLPVTGVHIVGKNDSDSEARIQVLPVRCSARSTALPKDCAEALELQNKDGVQFRKSGEYLISPQPDVVEPFVVRCDFTTFPGKGVTVIRPNFPKDKPLSENSTNVPTNVPYNGVEDDQVKALVEKSAHCYQGVRFDCYHTTFLSGGSYFKSTDPDKIWKFWGGGEPAGNEVGTCACGDDDACGGLDSSEGQRTRPCNCDVLDEQFRKDAGIIDKKKALPITLFQLGSFTNISQASLTIGDLYCAQEPLNLNECELGFHDCHELATCEDLVDGYHCVCPEGYKGRGVVNDSSDARANGRECFDDDECKVFSPCSSYAICTNLPGDFNCTCKNGFRPVSKTDCEDIDECKEELDDCGENSICENLIGSYRCICQKGFRGDGKECLPVGQCSCFGDPHCSSFDDRWLHYQGDCHYVMAKDGCGGQAQTFQVNAELWRKGQEIKSFPYSWVKSVTVLTFGKHIRMDQGPRLIINGERVSQYIDSFRLQVVQINGRVKLTAVNGLEVIWDGEDRISITVPESARNNTCGLCGNYDGNPDNDWTVGPRCPEQAGTETDNYDLFGRSWALPGVCAANCSDTEPPPPPEECQSAPKIVVEGECQKLFNVSISPFKECLETRSPDSLAELTFSCVFDLCASEEELDVKVCRLATTIAKECAEVDKIPIKKWRERVESCEDIECENNQVYSDCGPANPATCFNMNGEDTIDQEACVEGCFCPDGWLLEGDKCIKEEECGCFHENTYIPTGERVVLNDCSGEILCLGKNNTENRPVECRQNEECRSDDGITGCYCQEGFSEVNGTCEEESCAGMTCDENMECKDGNCVCKNGFQGECGICVDINECETNENNCNGRGEMCVNVPGTFRCDCKPGFERDGNRCKDVNECEILAQPCGDNSKCVNTLGGYVCECCAGYKHGPNSRCIRNQGESEAPGRCCACEGQKCSKEGKVCGTDGNTYASYRALSRAACIADDPDLVFNYPGECEENCENIVCDRHYEECKQIGSKAFCHCPICVFQSNHREVCGTDGKTYPSVCSLKRAACRDEFQDYVAIKSQGACPGDGNSEDED